MARHEMENNPIDINVAAGESMNLTTLESDACLKERNTAINQINAMMRFKGKAKNDIKQTLDLQRSSLHQGLNDKSSKFMPINKV